MQTELDLVRISQHIALTTCAVCDQVVPRNFAVTGVYFRQEEHFCSITCQDRYEHELSEKTLERLRVGL